MTKALRLTLKTILWIIGSLVFLLVLIIILIQVPAVQNYLRGKAVTYLENKIHTKVAIGSVQLSFPTSVKIKEVYLEDQRSDTLLYTQSLLVNMDMWKLMKKQVAIEEVNLQGLTANISRGQDSVYNFDYIIHAFATEDTTDVTDTTSSSFGISLDKINFDRISLSYMDSVDENYIKFYLGHFDTRIKQFDLDKMAFNIPTINVANIIASISQQKQTNQDSIASDTATTSLNLQLALGKINVSRIHLDYLSQEMDLGLNLGQLLLAFKKTDLPKQNIQIENIDLNNTTVRATLNKPTTIQKVVVETAQKVDTLITPPAAMAWTVGIERLQLAKNHIQFDNEAMAPISKGLDYGHMDIRNLGAAMEDLVYQGDSLKGKITRLTLKDKSGFEVDSLHADLFYGPHSAYIKDLYLKLPHTLIRKYIALEYSSLAGISEDISQLGVAANLDGTQIGLQDILLLAPFLEAYPSLTNFRDAVIKVYAKVEGRVGDLHIPTLDISGLGETNLKASGRLQGLPDPKQLYMDIQLADFNTTQRDITLLAPPSTLPASVRIPDHMHAAGHLKGSMEQLATAMQVQTTDGNAQLDAVLDMRHADQETYTADVKTVDLDLGRILQQPDMLGKFNLQASVKGSSFNPKKMNLDVDAVLTSGVIKGYNYQNLTLQAHSNQGKYQAAASMADPNIHFKLDGQADLSSSVPAVQATLNLDSLNLQALNLTADSMRIHGKIVADIPTADPDSLNARIDLTQFLMVSGSKRLVIDTVRLASTATPDSSTLNLAAPGLGVLFGMSGKYKLTELGPSLQQLFNGYFNTDSLPVIPASLVATDTTITGGNKTVGLKSGSKRDTATVNSKTDTLSPQRLQFSGTVFRTEALAGFVPDLKQMDTIRIAGSYNSQTPVLALQAAIPEVIYGTDTIESGNLQLSADKARLDYRLGINRVAIGTAIQLHEPSVYGQVANDKITTHLLVKDKKSQPFYQLGATVGLQNQQYRLQLLPDSLLLDYRPWQVSRDNFIQYDSSGLLIHHFQIADAGQELNIQSTPENVNSPVDVTFKDFKIETLTKIVNQDSIQVGGLLNGKATLDSLTGNPLFTAGLQIKDLNFRTDTLGDIQLKVDNKVADTYHIAMQMTGQGNDLNLSGNYFTAPESRFDFNFLIHQLNLTSIEGLTLGYLKDMSGSLDGQLNITGTTDHPKIDGGLHFNQAAFNVAMLNAAFKMPDENIAFNDQGIQFKRVRILDSSGNHASINGLIKTTDYLNYGFDLKVNARDFQVINSTKADNPLYYGRLYIDTRLGISGNMDRPVVDGTIGVNKKTALTVVLPTTDPSIEDRQGVVAFVQKDQQPNLDSILVQQQLDSLKNTQLTGMDVSATIDIDKEALFTIIIDERSGDLVKLRGEAHLNGGIDASGKTSLTGTYEVNDGSYNLSYATVKRKFNFKKGSTIIWTGDPTSANVDLTAVYVANVPPIDLVENQLSSSDNTIQYKQKLPFNVELMMKNELMKPDISFDINLPDDKSKVNVSSEVVNNVNTKLAQIRTDPNEMNKQVLGVLVLGHFIGDNPLASSGAGLTVEGAIRNSVSGLLSDQLNRLAGDLINGVDLDFGLTSGEDYSSGTATTRTDLSVGVSKSFLDDRLTVSVGNNFNLEGAQQGEKATNIAGNVSVNYKLSRDGRYMLRAYRMDRFIVIQGQVIETGLGFTMTLDYNKFKELLRGKTKKQKEWRRRFKKRRRQEKNEDAQPTTGRETKSASKPDSSKENSDQ